MWRLLLALTFYVSATNGISQSEVVCACKRTFQPVCGTDGKTYNSLCRLLCASYKITNLRLAYNGTCCPKPFCPPITEPLCDNHGQTHENECMFRYNFCLMRKVEGVFLTVSKRGPCNMDKTGEEVCIPSCTRDYSPVCDAEGNTHSNLCMFNYRKCMARKSGTPGPSVIAYRGECSVGKQTETSTVGQKTTTTVTEDSSPTAEPQTFTESDKTEAEPEAASASEDSTSEPEPEPSTESSDELIKLSTAETESESTVSTEESTTEELPQTTEETCFAGCTKEYSPICDIYGKTYENICVFEYNVCMAIKAGEAGPFIIAHQGSCEEQEAEVPTLEHTTQSQETNAPTVLPTTTTQSDILATDESFESTTVIPSTEITTETLSETTERSASTHAPTNDDSVDIDVSTTKPVEETTVSTQFALKIRCTASHCTKKYDPVCDNEGRTHRNFCIFEFVNCEMANMGKSLSIAYSGPCPSTSTVASAEDKTSESSDLSAESPNKIVSAVTETTSESSLSSAASVSLGGETATDSADSLTVLGDTATAETTMEGDFTEVATGATELENNTTETETEAMEVESDATEDKTDETEDDDSVSKLDLSMCPDSCSESLPFMICDNRNVTHWNLCFFNKANCDNWKEKGEELVLVHFGPCDSWSVIFTLEEEDCPEVCTLDYFLLCDNENETHPNLCRYQSANCRRRKADKNRLMIKHFGQCVIAESAKLSEIGSTGTDQVEILGSLLEPSKIYESIVDCPTPSCPDTESPVCDGDGHTHKNLCVFNHARCVARQKGIILTLASDGPCAPAMCQNLELCSPEYDPVCGSDFQTYWNRCVMLQQQCKQIHLHGATSLEILFEGECTLCFKDCQPLDPANTTESDFICDSLGITHAVCEFEIAACVYEKKFGKKLTLVSEGRCCPKAEDCQSVTQPVCDSFGNTHQSMCLFEVAQCEARKAGKSNLEVVANGPCEIESIRLSEVEKGEDINLETGCPEACAAIYDPVCGSDGKTYPNACYLQLAACAKDGSALSLSYKGECCQSTCGKNWNPVCDSTGTTHMNLCEFGRAKCLSERGFGKKLKLKTFGICADSFCVQSCTAEYSPVCGTDGRTYANACLFQKAKCINEQSGIQVSLAYAGSCCNVGKCPYTYDPVCDNQGVTHVNKCVFEAAQCLASRKNQTAIEILYQAPCCDQPCTEEYSPVCDGLTTYANLCKFRIAQCKAQHQGEDLSIQYNGKCCERLECPLNVVVCDSEGQTHLSLCELKYKQCLALRLYEHNITVAHWGECCINQPCPDVYEPVCDSLGKVHESECAFDNAACIHEKMFNTTLSLEYSGECCEKSCGAEWDPVCDQHGKLYKNKCLFEVEACEADRKSQKMLLMTPCSSRRTARLLRHLRL